MTMNNSDSLFLQQNQLGGDGDDQLHSLDVFGKKAKKQVVDFLKERGIEFTITWGGYYDFSFYCSPAMWEEIKYATQNDIIFANPS